MRSSTRVAVRYGPTPTIPTAGVGHQDAATTSVVVTLPTGIAVGDLLLLQVSCRLTGNTVTTPTGWTAVTSVSASGATTTLLSRVADGTEGLTLTVNYASAGRAAAVCVRVTGAGTLGTVGATNNGSTTTGTAASLTITGPNRLLIGFFTAATGAETISLPSGMTSVTSATGLSGSASGISVLCTYKVIPASGATGTFSATISPTAATMHSWLVPVKPNPS